MLPLHDEALGWPAVEAADLATTVARPGGQPGSGLHLAPTDADPSGRWAYAMAKRAQELMATQCPFEPATTSSEVANLFGVGQDRVVARLVRRALAGLPLAVTDNQRTFLAVDDLAGGHRGRWVSGRAERGGVTFGWSKSLRWCWTSWASGPMWRSGRHLTLTPAG